MSQEEYDSVVRDMRLPNGLLFGLPIVLDTDREDLKLGDKVRLGGGVLQEGPWQGVGTGGRRGQCWGGAGWDARH
jgi:hypothetical protein